MAADRPFKLPEAGLEGQVDDELATLIPQAGTTEVRALVAALFQAISDETSGTLGRLFSDESTASFPGAENQTPHVSWLRRFNKGNYGAIPTRLMYREESIEIYRDADLGVLRSRGHSYFVPAGDELVVVVPLTSPSFGGDRLFGTELHLLLSARSGELKIHASYEDYALQ